jgi:uncharacterized protein with von Willebrand factor type A (vWA) domain
MYQQQNHLVYRVSEWDKFQWDDYIERNPKIQRDTIAYGERKVFNFGIFAVEVFHRLHSLEPRRVVSPNPEARWALRLHQSLDENPEFDRLRESIDIESALDPLKRWLLAGVGAADLLARIVISLPEPPANMTDPNRLRGQYLALRKRLQQLQPKADDPRNARQIADIQEQLKAIEAEGHEAVEIARSLADGIGDLFERNLTEALKGAIGAVTGTSAALDSFGWDDSPGSQGKGGSLEDKLRLARAVLKNPKLVRIAKLAGRMKTIANRKRRSRTVDIGTTVHSIGTGNDLELVLPTELVKLALPVTRPLFARDYSERTLLQYRKGGKERTGRGPIVVCLDSSGSMEGALEEWSKAVAIALLTIAAKEKRTCRILHFTNRVERVDDFERGKPDPAKLVASMESFYGGGTNWARPLDSAVEIIRSEAGFKRADIVLITDGECAVSDPWLEEFRKRQREFQFSTFGILLGRSDKRSLERVTDRLVTIDNLADDSAVETVFEI